jgi:hypothetical protein
MYKEYTFAQPYAKTEIPTLSRIMVNISVSKSDVTVLIYLYLTVYG